MNGDSVLFSYFGYDEGPNNTNNSTIEDFCALIGGNSMYNHGFWSDVPISSRYAVIEFNSNPLTSCYDIEATNLTINQGDTSIINVTACNSYTWNDSTYTQSGTYYSNIGSNNNYSIYFDGIDDYTNLGNIDFTNSGQQNEYTISKLVES